MDNPTSYLDAVVSAVQEAMRDAGVTVHQLSTTTGIARSTLTRRLTGHSPFTVNELAAIASALEVPVGMLAAPRHAA